jgi:hypothetical protein
MMEQQNDIWLHRGGEWQTTAAQIKVQAASWREIYGSILFKDEL